MDEMDEPGRRGYSSYDACAPAFDHSSTPHTPYPPLSSTMSGPAATTTSAATGGTERRRRTRVAAKALAVAAVRGLQRPAAWSRT